MSSFATAEHNARGWPAPDTGKSSGPITIERVVAALTPLFAAASGWVSTEVAKLVNVNIPAGDFTAIFVTGSLAAAAAAIKWLHGRSQWTQLQAELKSGHKALTSGVAGSLLGGVPAEDIEALLKAHEANIVQAVGKTVGASPQAEDIAAQIVARLWPTQAATAAPPPPAGQGVAGAGS